MMEKKRSIGVTIFGWAEIIIGLLGTIVFVYSIFCLFWIMMKGGEEAMGLLAVIPMLFLTAIFPLFLFAGIGILRLKPWGIKINLMGIPLFILLLQFVLIGKNMVPLVRLGSWGIDRIVPIVLYLFVPIAWYYFTRPSTEEQFRYEESLERTSWNPVILLAWLLMVFAIYEIIIKMLSNYGNRAWISVFLLIGVIGVLKLKNWARILTILTMLIGIFFPFFTTFTRISVNAGVLNRLWFSVFGSIIIRLLIIIYLTRPKVKEQFK